MRSFRTSLLSVSVLQLPSPFRRVPRKTFSRAGEVLLLDWNSCLFSSRLSINKKERPPESTVLNGFPAHSPSMWHTWVGSSGADEVSQSQVIQDDPVDKFLNSLSHRGE